MQPSTLAPQDIIKRLGDFFAANQILTDEASLKIYGKDWTKFFTPDALAIVLPTTVGQISKFLAFCNEHRISVVTSGGRTGLAGGSVATNKEIVLSLAKLNKIIEVDDVSLTITAEAGAITENLQKAASEKGLLLPLDLAAKGSCHIGGNVATNAGGLNVIRYGMTRLLVLGLEVVLANGEVLDFNKKLTKDNTGYDLKQLFIGSEGTLGVITKVTLKLQTRPKSSQVAFLGIDDIGRVPKVLTKCYQSHMSLRAFEFLSSACLGLVLKTFPSKKSPLSASTAYYLLLEFDEVSSEDSEKFFEDLFSEDVIADGTMSTNSSEYKEIWSLRENITESISTHKFVYKNDIAVAVSELPGFLAKFDELLKKQDNTNLSAFIFGHIGDGNVHLNLASHDSNTVALQASTKKIESAVTQLLVAHKGSISAEHGIGLLKKDTFLKTLPPTQLQLMKSIRSLLDPNGILNPGKIFDM